MDVSIRLSRVSSVLASVIHSIYSLRWLGGNPSQAVFAFLFFFNAAVSAAGSGKAAFGAFSFTGFFTPSSFN